MDSSNSHTPGSPVSIDEITAQLQKVGVSTPQPPSFEGVQLYPEYNPVDVFRSYIIDRVHKITEADPVIIDKALAWTQDLKHGDLVLPVPALRLKGKKPDEIAVDIQNQFDLPLLFDQVQAEKSFVRFFFKPAPLAQLTLKYILQQKTQYGFNSKLGLQDPNSSEGPRKKLIVEYSSPNIAKEFHTGHLRSTIIGGFMIKLYRAAGWDALSMNYLGDWGKQYGMLSQGFEKYGSEEELARDPIKHLNEVYVKINQDNSAEQKPAKALAEKKEELEKLKNPPKPKKPAKGKEAPPEPLKFTEEQEKELQEVTAQLEKVQEELVAKPSIDEKARQFFKRMVDSDQDALKYWQKFRDLSIEAYKHMYARLNIAFDEYSGESTVEVKDMDKAAEVLEKKGISEDSKGAVIVDLSKHGAPKLGKTLVKKRDGTSLYLTRDVAANYERYEKHHFDKMIYVIASQQDVHVAQFFKILELMGSPYSDAVAKCEHITFGMVKDPKGQTMSTRKGTVVSLADSLDAAKDFMHNVMKKNAEKYEQVENPEATADTLAISAIMCQDYSGKMINNYNFDMERMTSFEGDTGPYLQYSHARVCSMERKAAIPRSKLLEADFDLIASASKEGTELIRCLAQWPDVFLNTYKTREPITVLTYLFKMTHLLSSAYDAKDVNNKNAKTMSVMYADSEEKKVALMALYDSARQVLANGMSLLGLTPVERM